MKSNHKICKLNAPLLVFIMSCCSAPFLIDRPPSDLGIRAGRSWLAAEAVLNEHHLRKNWSTSKKHVSPFALQYPLEGSGHWESLEKTGRHLSAQFSLCELPEELRAEIENDFVDQNKMPKSESKLRSWAEHQAIDLAIERNPGWTSLTNELGLETPPSIGLSEVGFSSDYSHALIFMQYLQGPAYGFLLTWSPNQEGYIVDSEIRVGG